MMLPVLYSGGHRVGAGEHEIGIGGLHGAHDRHHVGRSRRVALVVDNLETAGLGVLASAIARGFAELSVRRDERHRLRPRRLHAGDLEPAAGKRQGALVPARHHRKISGVVELAIDVHAEHADRNFIGLHDDGHGRRDHVCGVGPEQQIDFVDADELGVDAGHVVGIALVVVIDELDRASHEPAGGVDVVAPDFQRQQILLAIGRHRARQRHAEADLDRVSRVQRRDRPGQAP
ncbi:MAG TPA: hypothetical protein VH934_11340 [Xanthobacteraceae bacterium]|jgi:hypothetical protein